MQFFSALNWQEIEWNREIGEKLNNIEADMESRNKRVFFSEQSTKSFSPPS